MSIIAISYLEEYQKLYREFKASQVDYSQQKYVEIGNFPDAACVLKMLKVLNKYINNMMDLAYRPLIDCNNDKQKKCVELLGKIQFNRQSCQSIFQQEFKLDMQKICGEFKENLNRDPSKYRDQKYQNIPAMFQQYDKVYGIQNNEEVQEIYDEYLDYCEHIQGQLDYLSRAAELLKAQQKKCEYFKWFPSSSFFLFILAIWILFGLNYFYKQQLHCGQIDYSNIFYFFTPTIYSIRNLLQAYEIENDFYQLKLMKKQFFQMQEIYEGKQINPKELEYEMGPYLQLVYNFTNSFK